MNIENFNEHLSNINKQLQNYEDEINEQKELLKSIETYTLNIKTKLGSCKIEKTIEKDYNSYTYSIFNKNNELITCENVLLTEEENNSNDIFHVIKTCINLIKDYNG